MTMNDTTVNRAKVAQAQRILADIFVRALTQGFFGNAGIELSIQDGTIQHIRSKLEQIEK